MWPVHTAQLCCEAQKCASEWISSYYVCSSASSWLFRRRRIARVISVVDTLYLWPHRMSQGCRDQTSQKRVILLTIAGVRFLWNRFHYFMYSRPIQEWRIPTHVHVNIAATTKSSWLCDLPSMRITFFGWANCSLLGWPAQSEWLGRPHR